MTPLYIAIEGPIGVGKSSLTRLLAERLDMQPIYEIVEENPFLSDFYEDIEKWSFQTEMFFLCHRYKELTELSTHSNIIGDYHILKNKVFAKNTLNDKEYRMFEKIYDILTAEVRTPDITVFLTAELPVLKERIKMRNRSFEHEIEDDYLLNLTNDYNAVYKSMKQTDKTLSIDTTLMDFVRNEEDFNTIFNQIIQLTGEHYVPDTK